MAELLLLVLISQLLSSPIKLIKILLMKLYLLFLFFYYPLQLFLLLLGLISFSE